MYCMAGIHSGDFHNDNRAKKKKKKKKYLSSKLKRDISIKVNTRVL